jgi:hypothetical protein
MHLERRIDPREVDKEKRYWRCSLDLDLLCCSGRAARSTETIQLIWGHEGSSG